MNSPSQHKEVLENGWPGTSDEAPTLIKKNSQQLIHAENLGSPEFKQDYNLRFAYLSGAMYKGIASKELVVRMAKAGLMGFLGTGGLKINEIEQSIQFIQAQLDNTQRYGMNLLHQPGAGFIELATVDLYIQYGVRHVEAAAFIQMTPALIKYRLLGLWRDSEGNAQSRNKIIAKVSRPEIAEMFLSPAPEKIVARLLQDGQVTREQAELSKRMAVADDLCTEADSGGHTDGAVALVLLPTIMRMRDRLSDQFGYSRKIRVGASGGIGTPEAVASVFSMGADFVLTGSINQCTVEAGTSDQVKTMLQQLNIQDTEYAPAGDMFELGAKVQVMKRGVFFPARANKLYELWRHYNALDEIDEKTIDQIEQKYFHRSIDKVYEETRAFYNQIKPDEIEKAEKNPKHKMALIFRWYFIHTSRLALAGDETQKVDYQVHTGPAMGAFNQWVKGTELEDWRNRHVDDIAKRLMEGAAALLNGTLSQYAHIGCEN